MDIVRRLQLTGEITRTADWQIYRASKLGKSKTEIKKFIKEIMSMTDKEIDRVYEETMVLGYVRDKKLYEAMGKEFIPYAENMVLQQMVKALKDQTKEELKNITQSMGFAKIVNGKIEFTELADFYQKTLDDAIMDIASGAFDYNSVLERTIDIMTNSGLRTVKYASGHHNRVEVAARRALMTGLSQFTGKITEQNAEKLGTEWFEVTRHTGAREEHQSWQGKVFTMEQLRTICGYGKVTGLKGANCRHDFNLFFPGISERLYTDEELERLNAEENTQKEWNGKGYTAYEATQKQRRMETTIRAQKRKIKLLEEGEADADTIIAAKCRWRAKMGEYADFSDAMGLPQQKERFYIGKEAKKKAPVDSEIKEEYKNDKTSNENKLLKNVVFKTGNQTTEEYVRSKEPLGNFRAVPPEQVVNVLRKESEPWLKSLTEEEKRAIRKYTYNSNDEAKNKFYKRLNAMLREDAPKDKTLEKYANIISGALKKSSLPVDVVCYRRLDINPIVGAEVGSIKTLKQFISTSVSRRGVLKGDVEVVIYAKRGTHGGYI